MSLFESASLVVTPNGIKESKLYSVKPTDGSGDMTVVRATTATRVNSSGLIESVATNVPRLDYTGSTCPSLLVEQQRTNLVLRSQEFDNASWSLGLSATIAANTSISPDGTQNADTLTLIDSVTSRIEQTITATSSTYTISIYAKSNVSKKFRFRIITSGTSQISNDFTTSNVWQRYSFTFTSDIVRIEIINDSLAVAGSLDIWGAQLEAGSNATSYIPTTTASVTRNSDLISKTGITDLIGQTEGTMYCEINIVNWGLNAKIFSLSDGTSTNRIATAISSDNKLRLIFDVGGVAQASFFSGSLSNGTHKLAAAYKSNDVVFYVDGVLIGSDTSATVPACSAAYLGKVESSSTSGILNESIKSAAIWKTRLTNAELATLTTL